MFNPFGYIPDESVSSSKSFFPVSTLAKYTFSSLLLVFTVQAVNVGTAYAATFEFLDDLGGGGGGGCVSCTGTPENKLTNPAADLLKVASPTTANSVLDNAAMLLDGEVRGNGMTDYLMMIMNKSTMAGSPISVTLIGHGGPGSIQIGDTNLDASTKADFVAGAKGKISMLTLFGCCVASGTGPDFLQMLANDLMVPVMAYSGKIGVAKNHPGVMDGFYVEGGDAAKKTYKPVPEPLTLLGVGTAISFGTFFKQQLSKKQKQEKAKA